MDTAYTRQMEKKGGVYLKDKLGVEEWAFKRADALKVLEDRRSKSISCSGGDVIIKNESGKFAYTGDNWYCERNEFKSDADYVEGSFKKASDYINDYDEKVVGQYYYVLV